MSSHGPALSRSVYLLLDDIELELELLLPLPHLHTLPTHSDRQSLILALKLLFVAHQLGHGHFLHLLDLRLFQVGVLSCIGGHVGVLAALEWRVVLLLRLHAAAMAIGDGTPNGRFLGLPSEWRMVQIII